MVIKLKTGQKIELDYNFLVMQYLEEYKNGEENGGGLKQLQRDLKAKKNKVAVQGQFIYAAVRSVLDEPLTYQETIRLIDMNEIPKINAFFEKEFQKQDEFQKKNEKIYRPQKEKEKINWAEIKYSATVIGISVTEVMKMNPIEFYQMIEFHNRREMAKYGK